MNILVVAPRLTKFIERDIQYLDEHFDVRCIEGIPVKPSIDSLSTSISSSKYAVWADVIINWFADVHAILPSSIGSIKGTPVITIIGGYDVADIPSLNYGNFRNPWKATLTKFVINMSDKILPVSQGLSQDLLANVKVDGINVEVVPLGFNGEKYDVTTQDHEPRVLTVALVENENRLKLKGIDKYFKLSEAHPDTEFLVVGLHGQAREIALRESPSNCKIIGPINHERLISIYQQSSVYCQLSLRESFGSALCEAMLCNCVPVCFNTVGISSEIEPSGFVVEFGDMDQLKEAVSLALENETKEPRQLILDKYPLENRYTNLHRIIKDL